MLRGLSESLTDGDEVTAVPMQGSYFKASATEAGQTRTWQCPGTLLPPASELVRPHEYGSEENFQTPSTAERSELIKNKEQR